MDSDSLTMANGLEFSYRAHGTGPTLVLLHAFPLNKAMWEPQVKALSDFCQVITVDMRGFGASQVTDGDFTLDDLAEDVHALLHKLGFGRVVLGGLSMGGYVAQAYLRRYGSHVRGLILADTRAGADSEEARARRLAIADEVALKGVKALAKTFPRNLVCDAVIQARPDLLKQLEVWIEDTAPATVSGAQRAMAGRPDFTPHLHAVQVPTLVIVGEEDRLTPPAESEAMHHLIPGSTLVRIPGAGHLSNMEAPEAFNAAVRDFMRQFAS